MRFIIVSTRCDRHEGTVNTLNYVRPPSPSAASQLASYAASPDTNIFLACCELPQTTVTHPIRRLSPCPGLSQPQHVQGAVQLAQGMPENAGARG